MKQVEVTILGQSYVLACPPDGEAALLKAVAAVDAEMSAIRDAGKIKARERMAVLAALNLAYKWVENTPPAVAPVAAPATAPQGGEPTIDLAPLIRRLDDALAGDGQLL